MHRAYVHARGIVTLLERYSILIPTKPECGDGHWRVNIVGRPIVSTGGCTRLPLRTALQDLRHHVEHADLLIVAVEQQALFGRWIKEGTQL